MVMKVWKISCLLSRIAPENTAVDGVAYTINTRYKDAAIKDYVTPKHCKTCVKYVYETE